MAILVQFEFPFEGPFGAQLAEKARDLAESIVKEPGLIWKIWTEDAEARQAGGVYLFRDRASAEAYVKMHSVRLGQFGVAHPRVSIFEINESLSKLTRGPIA